MKNYLTYKRNQKVPNKNGNTQIRKCAQAVLFGDDRTILVRSRNNLLRVSKPENDGICWVGV